jgi:hypothetical protein
VESAAGGEGPASPEVTGVRQRIDEALVMGVGRT